MYVRTQCIHSFKLFYWKIQISFLYLTHTCTLVSVWVACLHFLYIFCCKFRFDKFCTLFSFLYAHIHMYVFTHYYISYFTYTYQCLFKNILMYNSLKKFSPQLCCLCSQPPPTTDYPSPNPYTGSGRILCKSQRKGKKYSANNHQNYENIHFIDFLLANVSV